VLGSWLAVLLTDAKPWARFDLCNPLNARYTMYSDNAGCGWNQVGYCNGNSFTEENLCNWNCSSCVTKKTWHNTTECVDGVRFVACSDDMLGMAPPPPYAVQGFWDPLQTCEGEPWRASFLPLSKCMQQSGGSYYYSCDPVNGLVTTRCQDLDCKQSCTSSSGRKTDVCWDSTVTKCVFK